MHKYFKKLLFAFSLPDIYMKYVQLLHKSDPVHPSICDNLKYFPFFQDTVGAIDGTHIACSPSADKRDAAQNCKRFTTQNLPCLLQF